ncbi:MAG: cytidylate kinase-like family protein [Terracidiphilus sp.]|jgi:cytidylate kinase
MFNVLTIAREYGSGGSDIGRKVAELLGWECLDKQIIERVAAMGKVEPAWAAQADEHAIAWWERVMKSFRQGGPESYIGEGSELGVDRDTVQIFTARIIQEAAKVGNCVIIGRSAQCVLRHHPHVLRMLVYAPLNEKVARMKLRHPHEQNVQALLRRIDSERLHYARYYYDCDSADPRLYHISMNSTLGVDTCARMVAQIIQSS